MNERGPIRSRAEYYWGTLVPMAAGVTIGPNDFDERSAEAHLDMGRSERAGLRSRAVWAASDIRDATAIAAIRSYSRTAPIPYEALRLFRVDLQPFHVGPVAIIDELRARIAIGATSLDHLIRQYWEPTGTWHIQEFIGSSMTVLEEVSATTERNVYIRRWVHYNQDLEKAAAL